MLYTRICMYTANIGYVPYMHSSYIGLNIGDLALYLAYTGNIGDLALYSPYMACIRYIGKSPVFSLYLALYLPIQAHIAYIGYIPVFSPVQPVYR